MTPGTPSEKAQPEPETAGPAGPGARAASPKPAPAAPQPASTPAPGLVSATHDVLFAPETPTCDACDGPLRSPGDERDERDEDLGKDEDDDAGGHGLYVWVRHGTVVYEEPPLCASCAAAITISALQRWDIEEEEG